MSHQVEVTKVIAAPPEQLYALVSDLPRMGEWSPENTGGKWVKGAAGPAVGAKFEGTNQLGKKKWKTLCTVTVADPGTEFGFDVTAAGMKVAGWGFRLERRRRRHGRSPTTGTTIAALSSPSSPAW